MLTEQVARGLGGDVSATMAVVCQNVSTDLGGKLTLHELTDQLAAHTFPSGTQRLYAVFALCRESPGLLIANRVEVVNRDGEVVALMEFPDVSFKTDQLTQRIVANLAGIVWPAPGAYTVRFVSRGVPVASVPVLLVQLAPIAAPQVMPISDGDGRGD